MRTFITLVSVVMATLLGCHEESSLSIVATGELDSITNTTAIGNGIILNTGGAKIVVHGICWDTTANPTIDLMTKNTSFDEEREFSYKLTGLTKNTTYYVRAYGKTSSGTSYGDVVVFTSYDSSGSSGVISAHPSDVLLLNGVEVYLGENPQIQWSPGTNPNSGTKPNYWVVRLFGFHGTMHLYKETYVAIHFLGSIPPSESGVYQLKPDLTTLKANEASLNYGYVYITDDPYTIIDPNSGFNGWSASGKLEVNVIRGGVSISFSNVVIDSNIVISGNLKLR